MTPHVVDRILAAAAGTLLPALAAACLAGEPISVGSRLQLLWDDYLIESQQNVSFRMHEPRRAERVLTPEKPWEGNYLGHVTVFQDGDICRMYYRGHIRPPGFSWEPDQVMCYAQSRDGIHWEKPSLGLFAWEGYQENNIVWHGKEAAGMAPFKDTRPGVPKEQRYKTFGGTPPFAMASPDGLHWRKLKDEPLLAAPHFGLSYWDSRRGQYVAYVRAPRNDCRSIALSTSPDYLTWSDPKLLDFGDAPIEHLYWNTGLPYFRAPQVYVGWPMRLMYRVDPASGREIDHCDSVLLFSRDGFRFDRRCREAFLRPGLDPKDWRSHARMMALGVLPTGRNEMSLYLTDDVALPTVALVRLVLRTDGFVSLGAPYSGGQFVTRAMVFEGNQLVLNVSTSAAGSVRAEIQSPDGSPIQGYRLDDCPEIYGDEIQRVVGFKNGSDLSALAGKPVRLRFVMQDADLYAFQFQEKRE